jgi:hypothetical protein
MKLPMVISIDECPGFYIIRVHFMDNLTQIIHNPSQIMYNPIQIIHNLKQTQNMYNPDRIIADSQLVVASSHKVSAT